MWTPIKGVKAHVSISKKKITIGYQADKSYSLFTNAMKHTKQRIASYIT
jgi:hypothetical protein